MVVEVWVSYKTRNFFNCSPSGGLDKSICVILVWFLFLNKCTQSVMVWPRPTGTSMNPGVSDTEGVYTTVYQTNSITARKEGITKSYFYLLELHGATVTPRWVVQGRWGAYKKSANVLRSKSCIYPQGFPTWCIAVWDQGTQLGTKKTELAMIIPTKHSSTWLCRKLKAVGRKMQCSTLIHF